MVDVRAHGLRPVGMPSLLGTYMFLLSRTKDGQGVLGVCHRQAHLPRAARLEVERAQPFDRSQVLCGLWELGKMACIQHFAFPDAAGLTAERKCLLGRLFPSRISPHRTGDACDSVYGSE